MNKRGLVDEQKKARLFSNAPTLVYKLNGEIWSLK